MSLRRSASLVSSAVIPQRIFDVEGYISSYDSHGKILRLQFIIEKSEELRKEAFELLVKYLKTATSNTLSYRRVVAQIQEMGLEDIESFDHKWIKETESNTAQKEKELSREAREYHSNLIKERARINYNDLGDLFCSRGDLTTALQVYLKALDYCSDPKHYVVMCLNVIKVSIWVDQFSEIAEYISKAQEKVASSGREAKILQSKLLAASGIIELHNKNYKQAARIFTNIPNELESNFSEMISSPDAVLCGALCALATFTRSDLLLLIEKNQVFKNSLEQLPIARDLLHFFHENRYSACFEILDKLKQELELDIFLAPCITTLLSMIRENALLQYCLPFLSIQLSKMSRAFGTDIDTLERELCPLIESGRLKARIDSYNKHLYSLQSVQTKPIYEEVLRMGKEYNDNISAMLMYVNLRRHGVVVKKTGGGAGLG